MSTEASNVATVQVAGQSFMRVMSGGHEILVPLNGVAGFVLSSAAPVNADGRPNGTIWFQTA